MRTKYKIIIISVIGLLVISTILMIKGSKLVTLLTMGESKISSEIDLTTIDYTFGNRNLPIYYVETDENKVAISFDAAWGAEDFLDIMEILDKHQVKTTYFVTGEWVEKFPEEIKVLVEKGHDIGNHSNRHPDMTKISSQQRKEELDLVAQEVFQLTGYEMNLFRPPYGAYDNQVIEDAYQWGYYPIQWDVDSLDWKDYGPDKIIQNVCQNKALKKGSIILLHNGATYTSQALDALLTQLEGMGYEIVPISELIYENNYEMKVDGGQKKNQ